jgi:hypothetical protein
VEGARTQTTACLRDTGAPTLATHDPAQRTRRRHKAARPNRNETQRVEEEDAQTETPVTWAAAARFGRKTHSKSGGAPRKTTRMSTLARYTRADRPAARIRSMRERLRRSEIDFGRKTAAGGALHRELRQSKQAFGTRMWRRILGETRLNPSARRVSGPGRTDDEVKTNGVGESFGAEKRKEIPRGLKSTPKITPKIKISDPNKNTPNSDFSKEIQQGFYTAEVSALPPSF